MIVQYFWGRTLPLESFKKRMDVKLDFDNKDEKY